MFLGEKNYILILFNKNKIYWIFKKNFNIIIIKILLFVSERRQNTHLHSRERNLLLFFIFSLRENFMNNKIISVYTYYIENENPIRIHHISLLYFVCLYNIYIYIFVFVYILKECAKKTHSSWWIRPLVNSSTILK